MRSSVLLSCLLLLAACGPDSRRDDRRDTRSDGGSNTFCDPGEELPCSCPDGAESIALCVEDGSRAGVCACGGECLPGDEEPCQCEDGLGMRGCADDGTWAACECEPDPTCEPGTTSSCTCGDREGSRTCTEASEWGVCECDPNVCTPNRVETCSCGGGLSGERICRGDGSGWGACECETVCTPGQFEPCTCANGGTGERGCNDTGSGWGACECLGCPAGQHDGGDGQCVPVGQCSQNYNDGGDGVCRPLGTCSPGYVFQGIPLPGFGSCVPDTSTCSNPPVANAGADQGVDAGVLVGLNGTLSTPASGLLFAWSFVSKPNGSTATLDAPGSNQPTFRADLNGTYVVELRVTDPAGCSDTDTVVVTAGPLPKAITVELLWAEAYGDLDLHYVGPGGTLFDLQEDAHYATKHPDWGWNGTTATDGDRTNDPKLEVDDIEGLGPERLVHERPFNGRYEVWVHNWCTRPGSTPTEVLTATVRVLVDGALVRQVSGVRLSTQQAIHVLSIDAANDGAFVSTTPSTSAPVTTTQGGCQ